jgi:hypothetical protein
VWRVSGGWVVCMCSGQLINPSTTTMLSHISLRLFHAGQGKHKCIRKGTRVEGLVEGEPRSSLDEALSGFGRDSPAKEGSVICSDLSGL